MNPVGRKKQIKTLWQKCFDDRNDFVEFYFDQVYKDENAMSLEKDGKVVSALQMIPYRMTWCGTEITVAYISGACTDPKERRKGLMGELLHHAFQEMRKREYDITALIPADESLFEFYRACNYTEVFDYSLQVFEFQEMPSDTGFLSLDKDAGTQWFVFFDKQLRKRPSCILHTEDDFRNNIIDTTMEQGLVIGILNPDGHPAGIAFITANEEEAFIKEMLYDNEESKERLLFHAAMSFQTCKVTCKTPPLPSTAQRYGMAMILNKEKMIRQWLNTHPDTLLSEEALDQMDSQTLAHTVFGYDQNAPYMSLMLD